MQVNGWSIPDELIPDVTAEALPPSALRWRALELTHPDAVRCVILGQDPYPQPGKATGLAFGLPPGWDKVNSSIANIAHEVWGNTLVPCQQWYTLEAWARQGVLLLNTQLSVLPNAPLSHAGAWNEVVTCILDLAIRPGVVRAAFGAEARHRLERFGGGLTPLVAVSHPCRYSAGRSSRRAPAFLGSRVFERINAELPGDKQVDWQAYCLDGFFHSSSGSEPRAG